MGVQHPGVEAGTLLGGKRVDLPAYRVHLLRQLGRRAAGGTLKKHVLDKMGGPVLPRLLMAGAGAYPDAQGGRTHSRDVFR